MSYSVVLLFVSSPFPTIVKRCKLAPNPKRDFAQTRIEQLSQKAREAHLGHLGDDSCQILQSLVVAVLTTYHLQRL